MSIHLDVQIASKCLDIPNESEFEYWAKSIPYQSETSVCLRIVDELEARELNKQYRKIDKATNVLSFPAEIPTQLNINFLGDIVICAPIVKREAEEQNKQFNHHCAHLLVHGILHLQGFDHENESEAKKMEDLEVEILQDLNISNPYESV